MTYIAQSTIGAELISDLGIGTDSSQLQGNQDHLGWYLDAIGSLFQQAALLGLDQGVDGQPGYQTGYGVVFTVEPRFDGDTAICPTDQLPYLAQYVGVTIPPDADDATARSLIEAEQGLHRGTPAAIITAAKRFLTGTQNVQLIERTRSDGTASGYWFVLVVRPDELVSASELTAAVNAVKPAGHFWQLVSTDGQAWDADAREWTANTTAWKDN